MSTNSDSGATPMKFESVRQLDVPKGRDGKHKLIVTQLLSDIDPVSYTHLDVYKRQRLLRPGGSTRRTAST